VLSFQNTVIGVGALLKDGSFKTTVIVPAIVPPGSYVLSAVLAGQLMAQTPVTVVAANAALPPVLQIINPDTGIAFTFPVRVVGGMPVTVRLLNFDNGIADLSSTQLAAKNWIPYPRRSSHTRCNGRSVSPMARTISWLAKPRLRVLRKPQRPYLPSPLHSRGEDCDGLQLITPACRHSARVKGGQHAS
jgi:hypothetical protein